MPPDLSAHLEKKLLKVENHTYLWVHLIFDYLDPPAGRNAEQITKTKAGIDKALKKLPKSIDRAYEKLLSRTSNPDKLRKALRIMLAARRPLTVAEMNIAMSVSKDSDILDTEDDENFQKGLQSWSGLFISVIGKRVYFLHQTAREFLIKNSEEQQTKSKWQHSITPAEAHYELAVITMKYLSHFAKPLWDYSSGYSVAVATLSPIFQSYAALSWNEHIHDSIKEGGEPREFEPFVPALWERTMSALPQWIAESCTSDFTKFELAKRCVRAIFSAPSREWAESAFSDLEEYTEFLKTRREQSLGLVQLLKCRTRTQ